MKKHLFKRSAALLMSMLLLGQSTYAAEIIDGYTPDYKYFETMDVPQDYQDQELFWFGSTDMTVSEKDPDYYVMRVLRGGSCDAEASVTVKFTDLTASYGENYTVWTYDDHTAPEDIGDVPAMVDFMQENSDSLYEDELATEDDLIEGMQTENGVDLTDGLGEAIANLTLTDLTSDDAASEVASTLSSGSEAEADTADGVLDGVIDASDSNVITAEQESLYTEDYPGHELTLTFAPGETEKLIAVDPKYSSAADGDCIVTVSLENPTDGMAYLSDDKSTSITITDEDEQTPATVSLEKTEYYADGDTVTVTLTRTGAINNMVCVNLVTTSDDAEMSVDYQGADAKVYFPMGITERTVELQVNHIRDEEVTFQVKLVSPSGCEIENAEATVTIATAAEAEAAAAAAEEAAASGSTGLISGSTAAAVTMSARSNISELMTNDVVTLSEEAEASEASTGSAAADTTAEPEAAQPADAAVAVEDTAAPAAEPADGAAADDAAADAAEPADDTDAVSSDVDYSEVPYVDSEDTAAPEGIGTDSEEEDTASLSGGTENSVKLTGTEVSRIGTALDITGSNFEKIGQGWVDGTGSQWYYSCKGVKANTWNGLKYTFSNPYLYDGVRVVLDGDHNHHYLGCDCITSIKIDDVYCWSTKNNDFDKSTVDALFTETKNSVLKIEALTYKLNGIHGTIYSIRPIYRKFNFTLGTATDTAGNALHFNGVDSAEMAAYSATSITSGSTLSISDTLRVEAGDKNGYLTLKALQLQDSKGNVLYTAYQTDSVNNYIDLTLTDEVLNALATGTTTFKKDSSGYNIGQIQVVPVFDYVDAQVTIQPSTYGQFDGDYAVTQEKTLTLHLGDRLTLSSTVSSLYDGKYVADGIGFRRYASASDTTAYSAGTQEYIKGTSGTFTVNAPKITIYPQFKAADNGVEVYVKSSDVSKLSTDSLLLKYSHKTSGGYTIYSVSDTSVHVDSLVFLSATAASSSQVPLWTVNGKTWSGNAFTFTVNREKAGNRIYLALGTASSYSMYGYAYNGNRNLSMLNSVSDPTVPAANAAISCGDVGVYPGDDGYFTASGVAGSANTWSRIVIYCDNTYTVKDVYLGSDKSINLGNLQTSVNGQDTASFTGITVSLGGSVITSGSSIAMNSKKLTLSASVSDGNTYLLNGEERTEKATGVTFYFLDSTTHKIKYSLAATSNGDGSWTASIDKLTPDQPDSWSYGDLVYAELTTDRVQGAGLDENGEVVTDIPTTTYAMLSTGYEIVASTETTESQTISFDPKLDADSVLGSDDASVSADSDSGTDQTTHSTRAYKSIPFLGGLNIFLGLTGVVTWVKDNRVASGSGEDHGFNTDDNGNYLPNSGGLKSRIQIKITCTIEELPYGGQRLKIGVQATTGNNAAMDAKGTDPYSTYTIANSGAHTASTTNKLIYKKYASSTRSQFNAATGTYGVPRMTISVQLGIYLDFGLTTTISDESGEVESSGTGFVFLGLGGYIGGTFSVEYQWPFVFPGTAIPMYAGLIGSIGFAAYIGATVDTNNALTYDKPFAAIQDEDGNFDLNNLDFNVDVYAQASLKGYLGVGFADYLGARIIAGLNFTFELCPALQDYYPAIDNAWGFTVNFTVGGQIDLIFVSIPLNGFSIPVTSQGFSEYFTYIRRSYRLWDYLHEAVEENNGKYSADQISQLNTWMDTLVDDMNNCDSTEKLLNDYNSAYDYASGIGVLSKADKLALTMITDLDVWALEDEDADTTASAETVSTQTVTEDGYILMQHTDSEWVANDTASVSGSYSKASTKALVEDSYSQTSVSMANIDDTHLLSIYLTDTSDAGEVVDPTLVYTIYDTYNDTWTEPVAIADDGTTDYTPALCDAGDQIVITWSSAGTADSSDPKAVLESMDIWTVSFDKTAMTMSEPVQLTNDSYLDYNSSIICDDETGDIAVYYVKSTVKSADDVLDYVQGSSVLCYRLYDSAAGEWVMDYYEGEISGLTAEQRVEYGKTYNGQRFLSASAGSDQPITDLTVCTGYNGLGIYAYTIDADGDVSDNTDTELYMRVYDFRTHKTYAPIRITDDSVSDAEPQLVRTTGSFTDSAGTTTDGCTWLFWLENDDMVNYINVTELLHTGINEDGSLKDDALSYAATPIAFEDADGLTATVANYQAITDQDNNLYLVWSQAVEAADEDVNDDITTPAPEEIFASGLILEEATEDQAYNTESGEGGIVGSSWSDPVRLTYDESHNDGVTGIIGSDGMLYIMHTQYDITYVGFADDAEVDEETGCIAGNPYEIGDTNLCFTSLTPVASIGATEFTYSDDTPAPGDSIIVTAKVENTGLNTAKGYTLSFIESRDGVNGKRLAYVATNDWLCAGSADYVSFIWNVPEDFEQVTLVCQATEKGYDVPVKTYSDPLEKTDNYEVSIGTVTQNGSTFTAEYTVTNTGSCTAGESNVLRAEFAGLYGHYDTLYGLDTDNLAEVSLAGLEPGEAVSGTMEFTVPEQAFDYCGYDQLNLTVYDGEDTALSDTVSGDLVLETPIHTSLTGDTCLLPGETTQLTASMNSEFLENRSSKIIYSTSDSSVITVSEDGVATAVGTGTAAVTATFSPYGVSAEMDITVTDSRKFTDVKKSAYYAGPVYWAAEKGIVYGTSDTTFEPDSNCTRAQFISFLWRAAGSPEPTGTTSKFTDVQDASRYYYKAVLWGVEQGIIAGTSETTFSPDEPCTRAQAVTFLWRYAGKPEAAGTVNPFTDVAASQYYNTATLWGAENGIVYGTATTTFTPDSSCTRAQTVTFLYRLLSKS